MPVLNEIRATAVADSKGMLGKFKEYLKKRKKKKEAVEKDPMKYYNYERFKEDTFNEPM